MSNKSQINNNSKIEIKNPLKAKVIYIIAIDSESHKNTLKIGEATGYVNGLNLEANHRVLQDIAKKRIDQYTRTAGIRYELLYVELANKENDKNKIISDKDVHRVLENSGIERKYFDTEKKAIEWFEVDLETAKNAIKAAKEGRKSLHPSEITEDKTPIILRPEQKEALEKTNKLFSKKGSKRMLWNAKMRFGKTVTALSVIKKMQFRKTLILTHRPVVGSGWHEDFQKIFYDDVNYRYGSRRKSGDDFDSLQRFLEENKEHKIIYFASMQDLRGSKQVGGQIDKNDEIFQTDWDLVIIDEAHEGTQTELGQNVINAVVKENTKLLELSGTPFNLLDQYKEEEIYTWDYIMEQKAKLEWDKYHPGDPNPYAMLPRMNILTYYLGKAIEKFADVDGAFNFKEFFRTDENGKFVHEQEVKRFLELLTKEDEESNYPFSKEEYRNFFKHTLWMLPGVKEARALKKLLENHPVFASFKIVNVAGEGDEEIKDALEAVQKAIKENEYTITLSCGRLTTGVSVPEWTAVLMLAGSYNTSAQSYMQTIFRVQTPAVIEGKVKEDAYVFDFAPDRALKVIAETAKVSTKAGQTTDNERVVMGEFLNFCPVISISGSQMKEYDTTQLLSELKKVYIEKVIKSGFDNRYLYKNEALIKLVDVEWDKFERLERIVGASKSETTKKEIEINRQGFTDEEYEKIKELSEKKKKTELTEEEKRQLEELKEKKKKREKAISILRGISVRMPLLIYGAEIKDDSELSLDNFTKLVDDKSWGEFMPKGVIKEMFEEFKKYYDPEVFVSASKRIREIAKLADSLPIEERIERIVSLFQYFKNPDKETVLTPWRVVNLHLKNTLGGYVFWGFEEDRQITQPVFVDKGEVTKEVFNTDSKILEINAKTGFYPLYAAYSIYRKRVEQEFPNKKYTDLTLEEQQRLWNKTLKENIFIIAKTKMAKQIAKRTLIGFRDVKINICVISDIINKIKNNKEELAKNIKDGKNYWRANNETNMQFDAIIGNPPYQEKDGGAQSSAIPIYNYFVQISKELEPKYISLIMPSRWMTGGKGLDEFRQEMLRDKRIRELHDHFNSGEVFPGVDIKGGVCYFLWDRKHIGNCKVVSYEKGKVVSEAIRPLLENGMDIFIRYNKAIPILRKVIQKTEKSFSDLVHPAMVFGFRTYFKDFDSNEYKVGMVKVYANHSVGYVEKSRITRGREYIDKYKVYVPEAIGVGDISKDVIKPILGEKNTICTETYIMNGPYDTRKEAENVIKYIKTKFFHFLLGLSKNTQHTTQKVYRFVPMQDFSDKSDIDWSKSSREIDQQLYKKYNLSKEEIDFIESIVREIE